MRLGDYFEQGCQRDPHRAAFVDDRTSISFEQAADLSTRIGAGLQQLPGLMDGARVAVYSPNDAMAFCCVLGIVKGGAAWVPVNVRNPVHVNAQFLQSTDCVCLLYHSALATQVHELTALAPSIRYRICIDGDGQEGDLRFCDLAAPGKAFAETPDDPDRVVTVFPTGGTTGLSKAAMWTHRTWECMISAFWASCPGDDPPVHLVAAPMTHAAGVVAMTMMPGGPTNVILRKADPHAIMNAIERHGVTHLYLPPTLIYSILAQHDVRRYSYRSLKYLITAAAPIAPSKLQEALDVFGACVCQSFGQAEAPMLLTFLSTRDLLEADRSATPDRFASCGRPTPGTRIEIMDDDGRLLGPGEKGEIVARGGLVFAGYFRNPEATADVSRFGWHHTGDVGFKDAEGFVYIVDRKKDMIITGGFNVFSAEVEQVVLSHPAVQDCAVIGVPDAMWGEAVKAIVELKPGQSAGEAAIIALVRDALGGVQAPKTVEFWPTLPRSPNGKVLKREIRDRFWANRDRMIG